MNANKEKPWPIEQKRSSLRMEKISGDGTFCGYASLFDRVDLGKDRVAKGAFVASIRRRGVSQIRMLYQHDPSEPIGVWEEIREDEKGLWVKGRILSETERGREVLSLMRAGAIDGLSIGFRTLKADNNRANGVRTILQADLWEISIVTFPMLPQARIEQVKSGGRLPSVREFEHWLTRDAGLTRGQARTIISKGFVALTRRQDAAGTNPNLFARRLRQAAQTLTARNSND